MIFRKWINVKNGYPDKKQSFLILIKDENGDLEEYPAIYYPEQGFIIEAMENKPCGTRRKIDFYQTLE